MKDLHSLPNLSEEQLVQCDTNWNMGCNGGNVSYALTYLETTSLNTEANYPYTSGFGRSGTCNHSNEGGHIKVTDYV